jgi:hypothetical protein
MTRTVATQKPVVPSGAPKIRTFLMRHSVTAYFVLAITISRGCVIVVLGPRGVPDTTVDEKQTEILIPLTILAMMVSPGAASILLTAVIDGRKGFSRPAYPIAQVAGQPALVRGGAANRPAIRLGFTACALNNLT